MLTKLLAPTDAPHAPWHSILGRRKDWYARAAEIMGDRMPPWDDIAAQLAAELREWTAQQRLGWIARARIANVDYEALAWGFIAEVHAE